jgi:ATP-dependent exoDNAse (exonuclease V) beta subunit
MIEKEIGPDSDQQQAIDIDKNAVVSAGAGSGKTTVLANRYLRLVTQGKAGVENILTLTFTRKAAREMRSRIYGLLLKNSEMPRVREQLQLFERSQISTLDSFCSQIARNWTQRFGVSPEFKVDEEAAVKEADRIALEFMLEKSGDTALLEFIYLNSFERVLQDFFVAFARSHLTVAGEFDFDEMWTKQKRLLKVEFDHQIGELEDNMGLVLEVDPGGSKSVQNVVDAVASLGNVRSLADASEYEELGDILSGFKIRKPGPAKNPAVGVVRELVDPLKLVVGTLADLISTLKSEELITGMFALCDEYQRRIISSRRSSSTLLYHDVVEMAKVCLLENTELRKYYKHRFTHIMIDEFQDNNRLQKEILYLLAERKGAELTRVPDAGELDTEKLFFVGDEKQSIYMFRGADVSVFKELAGEIEKNGGKALTLPKNYRTEPGLIEFFNTVFSSLMKEADHDFDARFEALQHREAELPAPPCIRILYKPHLETSDGEFAHGDDAEAMAVARFIKEAVADKNLDVVENNKTRPAGFGDFALLMRSTSNQNRYEQAFRIMGIPHTVDSTRSLFLESPVNDMYNLLQLVVYPEDRLAYAALLRSPFVNISDDGFLALLLSADPPFAEEGINNPEIDESDRSKLQSAAVLYKNLRAVADKIPLTELVSNIWYRYGYRYMLLKDPTLHPYLEYYDYLRELARIADAASTSLVGFLDTLRPHIGKYERLGDLDVLKDEENVDVGVRILTIHRSKGLEFPVVILANSGNRGSTKGSGAPFYYTNELGITFNIARELGGKGRKVNYFYRRGKDEQERMEIAEAKRVMYVALTRAKHHLVISGRHNSRNRNDESVPLNMILASLGWETGTEVSGCEALKPYLREIPEISMEEFRYTGRSGGKGGRRIEESLQVYHDATLPVTPPSPPEWTATGLEALVPQGGALFEELPTLPCDSILANVDLGAAFGTLCHSIIETGISDIETGFRIPSILRERLVEDDLALVIDEAKRLTSEFLTSPAGNLIDGARKVDTEVPFLLKYERDGSEAVIAGTIDLLVDRGDENIIIDFKTDRFLRDEEYFLQASIYREAVFGWTGRRVRCYLLYLRGNKLIEVPERPLPDLFSLSEPKKEQGENK